ncbi:SDR family NAD(P)-dependent oxidoreductase [Pseudomonas viridiflava]|uniref:SDR family NAD(P)-dependent oxidoreductase n=4 Tax=Pseudomonas viridiflava TaxID=33069 RepID=UPI000F010F70|nr:SDR family NAD(P)-dependent oxidoreductase [Pseudomonas viridiflava]
MQTFSNKVAIITGGSSGIGKEVAKRLVEAGARVVIGGRDAEKLAQAALEIDASGQNVHACVGDIAQPTTAQALVDAAVSKFGGVDILINNAGIFNPKSFLEVSPEEYDSFLDIILKGKFFMAQAAAKAMLKRGAGAIVQTGSLWAIQAIGATPSAAYSAANAGVHALTRNLALELAGFNIRINTVAPAVVETPVYGTFMDAAQVEQVLPTFNAFHPLGRNGQPADVAQAILFLASDEASWITGTVLPVDGGVTAGRH